MSIVTAHDGTKNITLNLPTTAYPSALHISNYSAVQAVNSAAQFVLQWDAVAGGTTNDYIGLSVNDSITGNTIFQTANFGQPGALNGTFTSAVIPRGVLAGRPTASGSTTFMVKVTDAASASVPQVLPLTPPSPALQITPPALLDGSTGAAYNAHLHAAGGQPPYTWSPAAGSANPPAG